MDIICGEKASPALKEAWDLLPANLAALLPGESFPLVVLTNALAKEAERRGVASSAIADTLVREAGEWTDADGLEEIASDVADELREDEEAEADEDDENDEAVPTAPSIEFDPAKA
jgi:hypothetical protein